VEKRVQIVFAEVPCNWRAQENRHPAFRMDARQPEGAVEGKPAPYADHQGRIRRVRARLRPNGAKARTRAIRRDGRARARGRTGFSRGALEWRVPMDDENMLR
jgi:hypothetical protein